MPETPSPFDLFSKGEGILLSGLGFCPSYENRYYHKEEFAPDIAK